MNTGRQMQQEKISVCMATYNGEKFIGEQLNSILNQLKENDEVIISDDGSSDNTIKIIEAFNDSRIRIYYSTHSNIILNFENALKKATGDIIFLSDQDDLWYDNKVSEIVNHLRSYDLIYTNASVFKDKKDENHPFNTKPHYSVLRNFIKNNCLGATMAFKAKMLKYSLPFPKNLPMHDMWIYFISALYGKTYYVNKPLIYYRRHGSNASNASEKTTNSLLEVISIRLNLFIALFRRVLKIFFSKA